MAGSKDWQHGGRSIAPHSEFKSVGVSDRGEEYCDKDVIVHKFLCKIIRDLYTRTVWNDSVNICIY